jgi:hypothetical protein
MRRTLLLVASALDACTPGPIGAEAARAMIDVEMVEWAVTPDTGIEGGPGCENLTRF